MPTASKNSFARPVEGWSEFTIKTWALNTQYQSVQVTIQSKSDGKNYTAFLNGSRDLDKPVLSSMPCVLVALARGKKSLEIGESFEWAELAGLECELEVKYGVRKDKKSGEETDKFDVVAARLPVITPERSALIKSSLVALFPNLPDADFKNKARQVINAALGKVKPVAEFTPTEAVKVEATITAAAAVTSTNTSTAHATEGDV